MRLFPGSHSSSSQGQTTAALQDTTLEEALTSHVTFHLITGASVVVALNCRAGRLLCRSFTYSYVGVNSRHRAFERGFGDARLLASSNPAGRHLAPPDRRRRSFDR